MPDVLIPHTDDLPIAAKAFHRDQAQVYQLVMARLAEHNLSLRVIADLLHRSTHREDHDYMNTPVFPTLERVFRVLFQVRNELIGIVIHRQESKPPLPVDFSRLERYSAMHEPVPESEARQLHVLAESLRHEIRRRFGDYADSLPYQNVFQDPEG